MVAMALRWFLLAGLLAACFPQANPGKFRLCEVGSTACPNGSFCSERGLCEPIPQVQRSGVTVSGQISESTGAGGQQPLPGAFVTVEGAGLWTLADNAGNYTLREVPPGSYRLTVHPAEGAVEPFDRPSLGQVPLELDPLDEGRTIVRDLAVKARGDLVGRVVLRDRRRFDPLHGGVQLSIEGLPGHEELSDPDGRFLISGLPEGSHRLHVHFDGYEPLIETIEIVGLQRQMLRPANPDPNDRDWVPGALNLQPSDQDGQWTLEGQIQAPEGQNLVGLELILSPLFQGTVEALPFDNDGRFRRVLPMGGVYNLFVRGPGWRSGRLSQIRGEPGQTVTTQLFPLKVSGGDGPDLDEDGIPDANDDDRDGDGCPNDEDLFPDDPLGCRDVDQDGLPDPTDNDDDNDGIDDLEESRLGRDGYTGDPRDSSDAEVGEGMPSFGSLDGRFRLLSDTRGAEIAPAAVQRPLYGDARTAQLLLQAQELTIPGGNEVTVETEVSGLPPAAGSEFALFATQQPCTDGLCTAQIEVLTCQSDGWRGEARCSGSMGFPVANELQTWRVWIRPTQRSNLPPVETLIGPEPAPASHDCFGVDAAFPIYGFIHRRVATTRGDFVIRPEGMQTANHHAPSCYNGTNRFEAGCIPWHFQDEDGDNLVMTSFSLQPEESAFRSCYTITNRDSGNPMVYFPSHAVMCNPLTLSATFSDGFGGEEIEFSMELTPLSTTSSFGGFGECWN